MTPPATARPELPHALAALSALAYAAVPIFAGTLSASNVPVFAQLLWRIALSAAFALAVAVFVLKARLRVTRKELAYLLVNAAFLLGGFVVFIASIALGTPVAKATALNTAYPLFTIILCRLFIGARITARGAGAALLSLGSVLVLLEVWNIAGLLALAPGDALALSGALFYALVIIWGAKLRSESSLNSFTILFYTLLLMLPMLLLVGLLLAPLGIGALQPALHVEALLSCWWSFIGISAVGTILSLSLLYIASSRLNPSTTSLILSTETIWVYILGVILFDQRPSAWAVVGGAGIVLSVFVAVEPATPRIRAAGGVRRAAR